MKTKIFCSLIQHKKNPGARPLTIKWGYDDLIWVRISYFSHFSTFTPEKNSLNILISLDIP